MMSLGETGLTDFTSSEWNLRLISRMCGFLYEYKAAGSTQIIGVIKNQTHLTNRAVIARYIRLMSKLGLLARPEEDYILSGEGKALVALAKDSGSEELTPYEKTFFYLRLFKTARIQLINLLATLEITTANEKSSITADYYKRIYRTPSPIWPRPTIMHALEIYQNTGRFPKSLETKFDCMVKWLQQIDLTRNHSLTQRGNDILAYYNLHETDPQIVYNAAVAYIEKNPDFWGSLINSAEVSELSKNVFTTLFLDSYRLFEAKELHLSDARAIWHYIWVKALWDHRLILNENHFRSLLDNFIEKKIIRSVSAGRDGKLAYISEG